MTDAYSPLLTLTTVVVVGLVVLSAVLMRYTSLDEITAKRRGVPNKATRKLTNMVLLTTAWTPLFLALTGLPLLECSSINAELECSPAAIASTGVTVSLILGLISFGLWVGFLLDRIYLTPSKKVFRNVRAQDRALLIAAIGAGVVAFMVMLFNQPG